MKEWLFTASVEGQVFTIQVLADIHGRKIRYILRRLSRELDAQHRLVKEAGEVEVSNNLVFQYSFSHILLRNYLYSAMGNAEKRVFHNDVATSLERIYKDDISQIVAQLAYHYTKAKVEQNAVKYLIKASEFALKVGDVKQAHSQIISAIKMANDNSPAAERGKAHYLLGYCEYLRGNLKLAEKEFVNSIEIFTQADKSELSFEPLSDIGSMLREMGRYSEALMYLEVAHEIALHYDNKKQVSAALRGMGILYRRTGKHTSGVEMLEKAIKLSQEIDDKTGMVSCYNSLAIQNRLIGNYALAQKYYESAIRIAEQHLSGHVYLYAMVLDNLARLLRGQGDFAKAIEMSRKALAVSTNVGNSRSVAHRRVTLAYTYYYMEEYELSKNEVELGKPMAEQTKDHHLRTDFYLLDGILALNANDLSKASQSLLSAYKMKYQNLELPILTLYSVTLGQLGDIKKANSIALQILDICQQRIKEGFQRYSTYYFQGLTYANLAVINSENCQKYLDQSVESYKVANGLCHELGETKYHRLLLDKLKPSNKNNSLEKIYDLFASFEMTASKSSEE